MSSSRGCSNYVLGLDLGTSECKACLATVDGKPVQTWTSAYATRSPRPTWAEQDPEEWLTALGTATHQVVANLSIPRGRIAGIGLTSAAHIGVLLDRQRRPVRPAILWSDQRSAEQASALERSHGDIIREQTYQSVSTTSTLAHLAWVRESEPDVWQRSCALMLSKDWILYRLVGHSMTDCATALSSLLLDARIGTWSVDLCDLAGISVDALPVIGAATDVAGTLTREGAEILGLVPGTPVVVGTLDSASEMCAVGAIEPGDGVVRLATAGGIQIVLAGPEMRPRLITYPHPVAPLWYCQAGTSSCSSAVKWASECTSANKPVAWETWDRWAASVPAGSNGLVFHPYLMGERAPHWDPLLRASFVGATMSHGPAHIARSVYEGTAYSIREALQSLDCSLAGGPMSVVGGGALSSIWVQILADVLGRPLLVHDQVGSALGAALLALVGLRRVRDLRTAIRPARARGQIVENNCESASIYNELYDRYVRVRNQLTPIYHEPRTNVS